MSQHHHSTIFSSFLFPKVQRNSRSNQPTKGPLLQGPTDPSETLAEAIVLLDTVGGNEEEDVSRPATSGRQRLDTYTASVTHV